MSGPGSAYDGRHRSIAALRHAMASASPTAPTPAPHPDAEALVKGWWVVAMVGPYAATLAAQSRLGGLSATAAEGEIIGACVGFGRAVASPATINASAARRAWTVALERADKMLAELRMAVWPMGKAQMPGDTILAAAHQVNERHGGLLPPTDLVEATRRFAHAAAGRRYHGRS